MLKLRDKDIIVNFLILACVLSNLSQLPFLVKLGVTQFLNIPIWIILFIFLLFFNKIYINKKIYMLFLGITFVISCSFIFSLFNGKEYLNSSILRSLLISIYIYIIGIFCSDFLDKKNLEKLLLFYVISALIVSFIIYIEYFFGKSTLSTTVYAYSSKNSISQIIFTTIIVLIFLEHRTSNIKSLLSIVGIFFQSILLFLLRSRATIIGYFLCLIYIIFGKKSPKKIKKIIFFALAISLIVVLLNQKMFDIFIYKILFAGRNFNDIDGLTSGRISILSTFPKLIEENWFTGIGSIYFECFPISVILNFGIFIGGVILLISYSPFFYSIKNNKKTKYHTLFFLICIGYFFNSLFEGLAPIGPGVKCYFMWLMYGILQGRKNRKL